MSFLPDGYEPPKAPSNYMRLEKGANKFRVISQKPIMGYEYWTTEQKPVRSKDMPEDEPSDLRKAKGREDEHWTSSFKHFWAFTVWNHKEEKIQILQITQVTIQREMTALLQNEAWGHPTGYDITVTREGDGMETKYTIMPNPHSHQSKEIKQAVKDTPVNLNALYDGVDPFAPQEKDPVPSIDDF